MKNIIILIGALSILIGTGCRKKSDSVSQLITESRPTITFPGGQFYSINTGGSLPTITATAYDSILKESYPVEIVGTEALDNTTPGLYIVSAKSTNRYGFYSVVNVYVAVTDVSPDLHLEGEYERVGVAGSTTNVDRLANGLYSTDNLFGSTTLFVSALFVNIDDSTIVIPDQQTSQGALSTSNNKLTLTPSDTTYSYVLQTLTTNRAVRTFKKQ